jgi:hypothetical protein
MEQLLEWIDSIPFTKPKRNITRDFADGVFVAEIMKMYHPDLVQIHNYPAVSALNSRFSNWKTLNGNTSYIQRKYSKDSGSKYTPTTSPQSSPPYREPSKKCCS